MVDQMSSLPRGFWPTVAVVVGLTAILVPILIGLKESRRIEAARAVHAAPVWPVECK